MEGYNIQIAGFSRSCLLYNTCAETIDLDKVLPVKNDAHNERGFPAEGGLWMQPADNATFWGKPEDTYEVMLNRDAKVFIVNDFENLFGKPTIAYKGEEPEYSRVLNYEWFAERFDAIWFTNNFSYQTYHSYPINLSGIWYECVLIFNRECYKKVIRETRNFEQE